MHISTTILCQLLVYIVSIINTYVPASIGAEVRPILAKSELSNPILAKVWELSDIDKDGRLSCDEFVIAMHLIEKAKGGLNLPRTLPPELFPGPMKYHTVDRKASSAAKASAERKVCWSTNSSNV